MIHVIPFRAEHYFEMRVQADQAWMESYMKLDDLRGLENVWSASLMDGGVVLACAGVLPYWEQRALVWSFLSADVNKHNFKTVHTAAKEFLDGLPFARLEAAVAVGFKNGHRWVKALGFEVESPLMRKFQVNGGDCVGYVRIK